MLSNNLVERTINPTLARHAASLFPLPPTYRGLTTFPPNFRGREEFKVLILT